MSAAAQKAREAARKGRVEQLKVLRAYNEGKQVTFKVHNNKKGFKLSKKEVEAELSGKKSESRKVLFTDEIKLLEAAAIGDADEVEALLNRGVDVDTQDADGMTSLHRACVENNMGVAKLLCEKGANINSRDNDMWTPLHSAASAGRWRIANFLIQNGADVLAMSTESDFPIDVASDDKVENVIQREMESLELDEDNIEQIRLKAETVMLEDMKKGEDINQKDDNGATFLHIAACNNFMEVLQYLLSQPRLQLEAKDRDGNTALHLAAFFGNYEVVMLLASKGADLQSLNRLGQRPLIVAEDPTMIRLLTALEKKGKVQQLAGIDGGISRGQRSGSVNHKPRAVKSSETHEDVDHERRTTPFTFQDD